MYQDSWTREVDCSGNVAWKIKGRYLLYQVGVAGRGCGVCLSVPDRLATKSGRPVQVALLRAPWLTGAYRDFSLALCQASRLQGMIRGDLLGTAPKSKSCQESRAAGKDAEDSTSRSSHGSLAADGIITALDIAAYVWLSTYKLYPCRCSTPVVLYITCCAHGFEAHRCNSRRIERELEFGDYGRTFWESKMY